MPLAKPIAELASPAAAGGKCSGWWLWLSARAATAGGGVCLGPGA